MANDRRELRDMQQKILKLIAESETYILDDIELITTMERSKKTSIDIVNRFESSKKIEQDIRAVRNQYTSVAIRGSILYFVVANLSVLDPMYQFSLAYIKKLFNIAM